MGQHQLRKHSFDPVTLGLLYQAFDRAWSLVEAETNASNRDAVRDTIALVLIDLAKDGERDVDRLTACAAAGARRGLVPPPRAG